MGTQAPTDQDYGYRNEEMAFKRSYVAGTPDSPQVHTRTDKQKEIDDWLPVTGSRNAKWWYAAFHNVTAMVGAGVLSLPSAMADLGWGPGVTVLILSWVITLYTLWQMVEMHEMVPGKRFDRYHELGQHAFGEKLGLYIVVPQQLICEVGVDIVYMVTGGKSLKKFHDLVCTKKLQRYQAYLLYHDLCFGPFRALPSPQLQLHLWCVFGCCSYVLELLYNCLDCFCSQGGATGCAIWLP